MILKTRELLLFLMLLSFSSAQDINRLVLIKIPFCLAYLDLASQLHQDISDVFVVL